MQSASSVRYATYPLPELAFVSTCLQTGESAVQAVVWRAKPPPGHLLCIEQVRQSSTQLLSALVNRCSTNSSSCCPTAGSLDVYEPILHRLLNNAIQAGTRPAWLSGIKTPATCSEPVWSGRETSHQCIPSISSAAACSGWCTTATA